MKNKNVLRLNMCIVIIMLIIMVGEIFLLKNVFQKEYHIMYNNSDLTAMLEESYPSHLMIDLRDQKDYEYAHIDKFINIPSKDGTEVLEYVNKKKLRNKTIYLMCYSGKRAAAAFNKLQQSGVSKVVYISFGYSEYAANTEGFIPASGQCDCLDN